MTIEALPPAERVRDARRPIAADIPERSTSSVHRWLREPLVHFLVLGALLFAAFEWWGQNGPGSSRIVITPGQVDAIAVGFARVWQRPPSEQEIKGLIDEHVREELATREAMTMGLDRDDTVIRRRLRQKFEFLVDDEVDTTPITDGELQQWLNDHPDQFRTDAEVAFRQVYVNPANRAAATERALQDLLARVRGGGPKAEAVGDSTLLPSEVSRTTRSDVARQFGDAFADAVLTAPVGQWSGPITSGFGLHLVFVHERVDRRLPALDEVRPLVERELGADRRRRAMDRVYADLLGRYRVTIERRQADPSVPPGSAGSGGMQ
jgi:hypothetical protein